MPDYTGKRTSASQNSDQFTGSGQTTIQHPTVSVIPKRVATDAERAVLGAIVKRARVAMITPDKSAYNQAIQTLTKLPRERLSLKF